MNSPREGSRSDRSARSASPNDVDVDSAAHLSMGARRPKLAESESPTSTSSGSSTCAPLYLMNHATASRVIKGEDIMFVQPLPSGRLQGMMYMVCDGHSGSSAAAFVATHLMDMVVSRLPADTGSLGFPKFAEAVRRAMCDALVSADNEFLAHETFAGTTVTAMLVIGNLITVANLGDSSAVLDTGASMLELTHSHRLQDNAKEELRLKRAGCQVAQLGLHLQGPTRPSEQGVGPLRVWPGGLCVSRSVGDIDAGPEVLPMPHIKQLLVPHDGCRIIMASDGLWDVLTLSKAVKLARSKLTGAAAAALVDSVLRDQRFIDDTSVIVVDILPPQVPTFPALALSAKLHPLAEDSGCGLLSCFRPAAARAVLPNGAKQPGLTPSAPGGRVELLADVDCLFAYPAMRDRLLRSTMLVLPWGHNSTLLKAPPQDLTHHCGGGATGASAAGAATHPRGHSGGPTPCPSVHNSVMPQVAGWHRQ